MVIAPVARAAAVMMVLVALVYIALPGWPGQRAGFLANAPAAPAQSTICIVDSGTDLTNDTRHALIAISTPALWAGPPAVSLLALR